jgi:hypothetical protein
MSLRYKTVRPCHILTLELFDDSLTNEDRIVVDPRYARYKTNKAKVISINHVLTGEDTNVAYSWHMKNFEYRVGDIVTAGYSSEDDDQKHLTCGVGIHYFKTKEAAISFCLENKCMDNIQVWPNTPILVWHDDGSLHCLLQKIDGVTHMTKY